MNENFTVIMAVIACACVFFGASVVSRFRSSLVATRDLFRLGVIIPIVLFGGWVVWDSMFATLRIDLYVVSMLFYGLLFGIYIMGIFSIAESSITMKILLLLGSQKDGLTRVQLGDIYNRDTIIERRLQRFLATGEIKEVKPQTFERISRISLFSFRQIVVSVFYWLFPPYT